MIRIPIRDTIKKIYHRIRYTHLKLYKDFVPFFPSSIDIKKLIKEAAKYFEKNK